MARRCRRRRCRCDDPMRGDAVDHPCIAVPLLPVLNTKSATPTEVSMSSALARSADYSTSPQPGRLHLAANMIASPELAAEIEKQSVYISPGIRRITVGAEANSIIIEHDESEDTDTLQRKASRFLSSMIDGFRPLERHIVSSVQRQDTGPLETNVYAKLKERGWVVELGIGQVALAGPALALANAIE